LQYDIKNHRVFLKKTKVSDSIRPGQTPQWPKEKGKIIP
jgi:hypothetical protein